MMRRAVLIATLLVSVTAVAQDLNPAMAAQIEHEQQKKFDEIDRKHGNKLPSEMSQDERRDIIHERAAAEEEVFEKHKVDRKDYTQYITKMGLDDRAAMKDAAKRLDEKDAEEKVKKESDDSAPKDPKDIPVQHGFNDQNPVTLEEKKNKGEVTVEHGLPPEAEADQAAASGGSGLTDSSAEKRPEEKKPPSKKKNK